MKKLFVTLAALLFTSPVFAGLDHWTCSNDQTVMYMALNTEDGDFVLWDDKGQFLAAAKFTEAYKTAQGLPFLTATLENGLTVAIAKTSGGTVTIAIAKDAKTKPTRFTCN